MLYLCSQIETARYLPVDNRMKRIGYIWLFLAVSGTMLAGTLYSDSCKMSVTGNDTIYVAYLREVWVYPPMRFKNKRQEKFYWRTVRGAKRQSAHSYGIAIDICTKYSNYWQWSNRGAGEMDRIRYENKIPQQIVDIFEKRGFIWGGRWYHYDTMHFEYRPEFLLP